jgi:hypothetical protein
MVLALMQITWSVKGEGTAVQKKLLSMAKNIDRWNYPDDIYYYLSANFLISFILSKIGPFPSRRQTHADTREEVAFRMAMK